MPNLGVPELLILLLIVVMIFGVGKLPEVGSAVGKAIREFREASSGESAKSRGKDQNPEQTPSKDQDLGKGKSEETKLE
jgi:sec-independent protein translocase protein TatA